MTTYQVYDLTSPARTQTILADEAYQSVLHYLFSQPNYACSLKQLKNNFSDLPNLIQRIENWIHTGLLARKNRLYFAPFPIYSADDSRGLLAEAKEIAKQLLLTIKSEVTEQQQMILPVVVANWQKQQQKHPILLASDGQIETHHRVYLSQTDRYCYYSILKDRESPDLAFYFEQKQPATNLPEIYAILGDVRPSFILNMCGSMLEKNQNQPMNHKEKQTIFYQVLSKLDYFTPANQLQIPFEIKQTWLNETIELLEQIGQSASLTKLTRVEKYLVSQQLLRLLGPNRSVLRIENDLQNV